MDRGSRSGWVIREELDDEKLPSPNTPLRQCDGCLVEDDPSLLVFPLLPGPLLKRALVLLGCCQAFHGLPVPHCMTQPQRGSSHPTVTPYFGHPVLASMSSEIFPIFIIKTNGYFLFLNLTWATKYQPLITHLYTRMHTHEHMYVYPHVCVYVWALVCAHTHMHALWSKKSSLAWLNPSKVFW